MKLLLVFDDWKDENGYSVYDSTYCHQNLANNDLHHGTTFTPDSLPREEIEAAKSKGFHPVFRVVFEEDDQ